MKQLNKIIKDCKECPYYRFDSAGDYNDNEHWCCNDDSKILVIKQSEWNDTFEIPDWCPLDNAGENTKFIQDLMEQIYKLKEENKQLNFYFNKCKSFLYEARNFFKDVDKIWDKK